MKIYPGAMMDVPKRVDKDVKLFFNSWAKKYSLLKCHWYDNLT